MAQREKNKKGITPVQDFVVSIHWAEILWVILSSPLLPRVITFKIMVHPRVYLMSFRLKKMKGCYQFLSRKILLIIN